MELLKILKEAAAKVLPSLRQQIWKPQQWLQDWKSQISFQSQGRTVWKNVQTTIVLILHASKVTLKILQARLQQYENQELPDVQAGFTNSKRILWIIEKAREFQKNIYFCFIDCTKTFDYMDHNKLWKILREMEISDHLTCLLRNLYAGQEATVRTRHATPNWFKIGKGVHQGWILSPCLFNFHVEYLMWNSGLDEAQTWIKIARRNINNLRYADNTTLTTENEEELKSLLMKVKEESEKG